jgi:Ca2+-binding RTX toxin-like protein
MPDSIQIGVVTIAYGNTVAESSDGIRPLTIDSPIYADEIIKTVGDGSAVEIRFQDGALLSQGPDSTVVIDDYVYDSDQSTGEMAVKLLQGTLRSVTGEIVDNNPEGFKIETPLATIGIRGTTTGHMVGADGQEEHAVVDFVDRAVVISPAGGPPRVISQDGMGVSASASGLSIVRPVPAFVLAGLEQLSPDAMQKGAPTFRGRDDAGEEQGNEDPKEENTKEDEGQDDQSDGGGDGEGQMGLNPATSGMGMPAQPGPATAQTGMAPIAPPMGPPPSAPPTVVAPPAPKEDQPPPIDDPEPIEDTNLPTTLHLEAMATPLIVNLDSRPSYIQEPDSDVQQFIGNNYKHVYGSATHSNTITGDNRANLLVGSAVYDNIDGKSGNDTIMGGGGGDDLNGNDGNRDMLSYANLSTSAGVNVVLSSDSADYVIDSTPYTDTITGFEHVTGTDEDDTLWGNSDNNNLYGGEGDDLLWGNAGSNSLYGNEGDDTFKFHEDMSGTIKGGIGTDELKVWQDADADDTYDLTGLEDVEGIEKLTYDDANAEVKLQATDFEFFDGSTPFTISSTNVSTNEILEIVSSADTPGDTETIDISHWNFDANWNAGTGIIKITGDVGAETLIGSQATDSITGGDGNDVIHGNGGNDELYGDTGNDSFVLGSNMSKDVTIRGGTGDDTLTFTDSGGIDDLDNVREVENIVLGDANTSITTDCNLVDPSFTLKVDGQAITAAHTFTFDGSNESDSKFQIYTGQGQNHLTGGSGDDTFILTSQLAAESTITGGDGTDRLQIEGDIRIYESSTFNGVEELELTDGSKLTLQWDSLEAYESVSTLYASDGGDKETLAFIETTDDTVDLNLTNDAPAFTDWGSNNIQITGGDGLNNITSVDYASVIDGGGGADNIIGGGGADTFVYTSAADAGDTILDFGDGDDVFSIANISDLDTGTLEASDFARVTSPYNGDEGVLAGEGFIYEIVDDRHGKLWFDDDTSQAGGEVLIADVTQEEIGMVGEVEHTDISIA